jgi:hypothetical protein
VLITGSPGCGKSELALDLLTATGWRRRAFSVVLLAVACGLWATGDLLLSRAGTAGEVAGGGVVDDGRGVVVADAAAGGVLVQWQVPRGRGRASAGGDL